MKVKKQIAILCLLFANILLLAHGVLPHFHHDGIICFTNNEISHMPCDSQEHNDISICCEHHHDNKVHHHSQSEDCDLKITMLRQADNSLQHSILHSVCCLSHLYYIDYPLNTFFIEEPDFGLRLRQKPYLIGGGR